MISAPTTAALTGIDSAAVVQTTGKILEAFKGGRLDVVVSTAVAEEGLDVCHCSLVVRFDLPGTARELIQSRGRARAPGSTMALMACEGEARQVSIVRQAMRCAPSARTARPVCASQKLSGHNLNS